MSVTEKDQERRDLYCAGGWACDDNCECDKCVRDKELADDE